MKTAIIGPNCIDPNVCHGDCCSIKIDVPKILAKEYIKKGYACEDDFIRSNVFTFHLRFDEKTGKCFLFDKSINGCGVYHSGIRPPQCFIYPTKFSNLKNKEIRCKRATGWKIIDPNKTKEAERLLHKFVFLSQLEARKELKSINKRLGKVTSKNSKKILEYLKEKLNTTPPSHLAGFKDMWDYIDLLPAEGISLQLKKFCKEFNSKCKIFLNNFLDCRSICDKVAEGLIELLHEKLYEYIKNCGLDIEGEYPFYKIFKVAEESKGKS